ncbi:MAG: sugar transferase, partial [Pseudomonadota bacterium]
MSEDRRVPVRKARLKIPYWVLGPVLALLDGLLVVAAVTTGDALYRLLAHGHFSFSLEAFALAQVLAVLTVGYVHYREGYRDAGLTGRKGTGPIFLLGWFLSFAIIGWVAFLAQATDELSRGGATFAFLSGAPALLLRTGLRRALRSYLASLHLASRSVFLLHAGGAEESARLERHLTRQGIELTGGARFDAERIWEPGADGSLERALGEARAALATERYDAIYLSAPWQRGADLRRIRVAMAALPVPTFLFVDPQMARLARGDVLHLGRLTAFRIQRAPLSLVERMAKRGIDVGLSMLLIVLLSPLLLLVAAAIAAESGRPILFRQRRQGFGGRVFSILKFRTMTVCEDGAEVMQARRGDARVTPLGRILRRTSIDELPQLFNVLVGDMSLVGPRPHALAHDNHYDRLIATYAGRRHV